MDSDLILCIGLALVVLSVPPAVSAWSDNRPPRIPALCLVVAGGLILLAVRSRPGGYGWSDLPIAVFGVIARLIN